MDKNGIHSFQESIKLSKKYNAYATNRANYLQAMGIHAKIKNADLRPIEMLAISPAKIVDEMTAVDKYNLFGFDISPYMTKFTVQQNAHRETMLSMVDLKENYLNENAKKDNESGNLNYILSEIERGYTYANNMGTEFDALIEKFGELGPQSMDYNDRWVKYKEDYHAEYKNLSNVAKVAATYRWLEGYRNTMTNEIKNISGNILPPVSESAGQVTVLNPDVIKKYFSIFNEEVAKKQNAEVNPEDVTFRYKGLKAIAREICK